MFTVELRYLHLLDREMVSAVRAMILVVRWNVDGIEREQCCRAIGGLKALSIGRQGVDEPPGRVG